jgi:hypothetical protein
VTETTFGKIPVGTIFGLETTVRPFVKTFEFGTYNAVGVGGSQGSFQDSARVYIDEVQPSKPRLLVSIYDTNAITQMENLAGKELYRHAGPVDEQTVAYEWIGG